MSINTNSDTYAILRKAGYTPAEATRISGFTPPPTPHVQQWEIAADNERKYADVKNIQDEYIGQRYGRDVYAAISSASDNGTCTTRRGTYRRWKTGDGRCATKESLIDRRRLDAEQAKNRRANGQFKRRGER